MYNMAMRRSYFFILIVIAALFVTPWILLRENVAHPELVRSAELSCLVSRDAMPPKTFTSDGCSAWPDGSYRSCCIAHDIRYWCGGESDERAHADREFYNCVREKTNPAYARVMRIGVSVGGHPLLPLPWRWGYGWNWPESL